MVVTAQPHEAYALLFAGLVTVSGRRVALDPR